MDSDEELVEIPSDCESNDDLCDGVSDTDEGSDLYNSRRSLNDDDYLVGDLSSEQDDYENIPYNQRLVNLDQIWEVYGRKAADVEFTKSEGSNLTADIQSPLDIFLSLFPESMIKHIADQTNLYCSQTKGVDNFTPVTVPEIRTFLGINIMMGIKRFPSYKDYWSNNIQLKDPFISSLMSLNRFSFLLGNFHLNDNSKEPKKGDPSYDKLYKLRVVIDELNKNFKTLWKPYKNQSIDETMVKFKGRSSIKQYMSAKPVKRGYKVWVRADEKGFVCEFQIYIGKSDRNDSCGLGERIVIDLTRELVGGNYHVYIDNFFTSVNLMHSLKDDNIFACGTVRQNRRHLPKHQMRDRTLKRGDSEYRTSYTGIRWVKWKDNRIVQFLSNFHDPEIMGVVNRRKKDGTLELGNCPLMVYDYNKNMGFVDKADQMRSTYSINRKSKKWWPRLFFFMLDTAVVNAFIIYSDLHSNSRYSSKHFRLHLVRDLVDYNLKGKNGRKSHPSEISSSKPQIPDKLRRENANHMPLRIQSHRRCIHCSTKETPKFSSWICKTCNVPLCLSTTSNCFITYRK